jgi:hypothetical protein
LSVARLEETEDVDPLVTVGADPLVVKVPAGEVDVPPAFVAFTQK